MVVVYTPTEPLEAFALMCDRATYGDKPRSIKLLETHISWLFVTDHFVYKLKKPVRFDFLDFSTPELRHCACLDEVRLNCRLSPDVYLATLPITRTDRGDLELAGRGEPVDWVVQMRRLPADEALDRCLCEDRVMAVDEQAIASLLAEFYARLPAEAIGGDQYLCDLERHIRTNAATCITRASQYEQQRIQRILGQQLCYLRVAAPQFDARVAAGHIVDGHGDLRPEHIYLESPPAVIDCIKFSQELRRIDVLDDLSFLAMECERLGRGRVGARIVAACQAARRDIFNPQLFDFYMSYRALVRAKVLTLRAAQTKECERRALTRQTHQYIDWAEYHAARLGDPVLIAVGGLMGTGKSTLAAQIAGVIGAELISTDQIRRSLYGTGDTPAGYGQQSYSKSYRARVYDQLFSQAAKALDNGRPGPRWDISEQRLAETGGCSFASTRQYAALRALSLPAGGGAGSTCCPKGTGR